MNNKVVYITGAGFSMDFGAPSQAHIIKEIFKLRATYPKKTKPKINNWIDQFEKFLKESLYVSDLEMDYYTLEDIYTPIDRSILEATSFREHTSNQLLEL
ncbi:hypothetical protein GCM10028818_22670 [Spirosoma horti]